MDRQTDGKFWKVDLKWTDADLCNWQMDRRTENQKGQDCWQTKPHTHTQTQNIIKEIEFLAKIQSSVFSCETLLYLMDSSESCGE